MNFLEIIRLIARYLAPILACALILSGLVFWSTSNDKKQYATHTLLNTGLISGYNIESNKSSRIDYAFTNNELENLINLATSYETYKELSARLMAHVLTNSDLPFLKENRPDLAETLTVFDVKETGSEEMLYEHITALREKDQYNAIYLLTNSDNPFFGIEQLEQITVVREGKSDMIRMEYSSIDPLLSQLTLQLLTDIFISKHRSIKEGQSDSVIGFFEKATVKTSRKLKSAEDELLRFRVNNQIINYYEQTRFISGNKEELDKQYQEELKVLAGAKSALAKIEIEIADKRMLPMLREQIAVNRSVLSKNATKISELDLVRDSLPMAPETLALKSSLSFEVDSVKAAMSDVVQKMMMMTQTPEGVETKDLLTQWLNNTIAKEESSAKLSVMRKRQQEYEVIYDRFAPLGSTLKRLEREIDVAEREYLENLHSYNQARLHKYNMEMSSNLKVIDAPYYPIKPLKSKRIMLVALAFIVGIILPTGLLIAAEMLDGSLKNPENAMAQTKLKLAGILPGVRKGKKSQKIDFKRLNYQALNLFLQELRAQTSHVTGKKKVVLFSTQDEEGKSFLLEQIRAFRAQERMARFPETDINDEHLEEEFEFIELPALLHHSYELSAIKDAQLHILVCKANRVWTDADKHALKVYRKATGQKPLLFLNGVSSHVMEQVVGEIPRKRSWLRKQIKSLFTQGLRPSTAF